MKKIFVLFALLTLALASCSSGSNQADEIASPQETTDIAGIVSTTQTAFASTPAIATVSETPRTLTTDYANSVSIPTQLIIGLIKLEDTEMAVNSTQAESLLPLLKFLKDLSTNNAVTQQQIDSLVEQALAILSPEQIQAIANMQITPERMMTVLQEQGIAPGSPSQASGNPPLQDGLPQGTPPAGGPGERSPGLEKIGTPPTRGMGPPLGALSPQLIDALIQRMENKTTSS